MAKDFHRVIITEQAQRDILAIGKKYGKRTYEVVRDHITSLEFEPIKKGRALRGTLNGLYSLHHSRFRIIYQVNQDELVVVVVAGGQRKADSRTDVYKILQKAIDAGHIVIPSDYKGMES